MFANYSDLFCRAAARMQLQHFADFAGRQDWIVAALARRFACRHSPPDSPPNLVTHDDIGRRRFVVYGWIWARRSLTLAGFGLVMLYMAASPPQAQSHAELCLPLTPPLVPGDTRLIREFADLLREEFEQYLAGVPGYFRCLDDERARAWREAAEVTAQYGTFFEVLRAAPP